MQKVDFVKFFASLCISISATASPFDGTAGVVTIGNKKFKAEIARTPREQAQGLMYRRLFPNDRCMLFIYNSETQRPIWMKNMYFSIDIIWLNAQNKVVEFTNNATPFPPESKEKDLPKHGGLAASTYIIELPAGSINQLGVKLGDSIYWEMYASTAK